MKRFWGLVRYEYSMSIRRWSLWFAYGLLFVFYDVSFVVETQRVDPTLNTVPLLWQEAAQLAFFNNMFACLLGGIVGADRLWRDQHLGLGELQQSTPLRRWTYLAGKYLGTLVSVLTPALILLLSLAGLGVAFGVSPIVLPMTIVVFLVTSLPCYAFVTAISLACPLFMPLRVYQVLFTGYWFWGNYLSPKAFPTISDTLLNASGKYAAQGFFGFSVGEVGELPYTPIQAALNIVILLGCAFLVLTLLERYYAWQARKA